MKYNNKLVVPYRIAHCVFLFSLACRCAEIAKKKGYKVFGLQFYGECWSGPLAEAKFAEYGSADPSKSFQISGNPPPPCDKNNPQECVGGSLINYVYRLKDGKLFLYIVLYVASK